MRMESLTTALGKKDEEALLSQPQMLVQEFQEPIARFARSMSVYCFGKRYRDYEDDVRQECFIGLLEAIEKFDPMRGAKFSTYASFWCRARALKFAKRVINQRQVMESEMTEDDRRQWVQWPDERALTAFIELDYRNLVHKLQRSIQVIGSEKMEQVFLLLTEGKSQTEIAQELNISKAMVNKYVKRIRDRLIPFLEEIQEIGKI